MKKCGSLKARNFVYPEETKGSKMAAKIRKEANSLTEQQREEYFKRGMQIIYGGNSKTCLLNRY